MSELKTPYLDKDIEQSQSYLNLSEMANAEDVVIEKRLKEYQSIKEALKRLERLDNIEQRERLEAFRDCTKELEAVKAERDEFKAFVEEFKEAWEDAHGGDFSLYRTAKSLLNNQS